MTNLFDGISEETIQRVLIQIKMNLDNVGTYGGHTLSKHVIDHESLRKRITNEDIKYATSFMDVQVAEAVVKSMLKYYFDKKIRDWLLVNAGDSLALYGYFKRVIGYGYRADADGLYNNLRKAVVVLIKDPKADWGFRVATSYPMFGTKEII